MHIIESIKDNYLICDCCGDRIAPDEVALEKTDKDGRTIHICIDCENYDKDPEMEDLSESIEDDLARIEAGGFEAFRDEDYDDPGQAMAVHQAAQNAGMSDLDYVNHEEVWGKLYDEDSIMDWIANLEELPISCKLDELRFPIMGGPVGAIVYAYKVPVLGRKYYIALFERLKNMQIQMVLKSIKLDGETDA